MRIVAIPGLDTLQGGPHLAEDIPPCSGIFFGRRGRSAASPSQVPGVNKSGGGLVVGVLRRDVVGSCCAEGAASSGRMVAVGWRTWAG